MKARIATNRRQFLTRSLATTTTALLGLTACRRLQIAKSTELDPDAIRKFGASLEGRIILPADPAYEKARRVTFWNPRTERHPVIVARCAHVDDLIRSIEFARRHGLETTVRAGGHSFLGWGTSNGMIIDVSEMRQITIDPTKRIGRVAAGVLSGDFTRNAGSHGLAPVLGQCPGVGVAGITLGGGLGWLSGQFGAACDNLLSARIVTADGRLLLADASSNRDLFWAIRGGSGNFGVATSLEFRLHPVASVNAGPIKYRLRDAWAVLRFHRDFMASAPDSFHADVRLSAGDRSVVVDICHTGDLTEGERLFRQFRSVAPPLEDNVKVQDYAGFCGVLPPANLDDPIPSEFVASHGVYLTQLSDEVIETTMDCIARAPNEALVASIGIGHYMHGHVCRIGRDSTAFELRAPGAFNASIVLVWKDPANTNRLLNWADETWRLLRPFSGGRIYANFQSYEGNGAAQAVFGGNHARLVSIKNKYDPVNFSRRNSNVQPAG